MSGLVLTKQEQSIQSRVAAMYGAYPFPRRTPDGVLKRNREFLEKLERVGVRKEDIAGKRVLDAGCGTGELACLWASLGAKVTAIDIVRPSLEIAQRTAQAAGLDITFIEGSLLDYPLPRKAFDIVSSHMVLHHTANPAKAFDTIARSVAPGGLIFICVFGLWGRLLFCRHSLWKIRLVQWLAGKDPVKRVALAERWFYHPGEERLHGLEKDQYLYDDYGVPQVKHHTFGEILRWFRHNDIAYASSWTPMEFRREYDRILAAQTPAQSFGGRLLRSCMRLLPASYVHSAAWANRPGFLSRSLTQMLWMLKSDEYMFNVLGRKKA